jgi:hypothetical protein
MIRFLPVSYIRADISGGNDVQVKVRRQFAANFTADGNADRILRGFWRIGNWCQCHKFQKSVVSKFQKSRDKRVGTRVLRGVKDVI